MSDLDLVRIARRVDSSNPELCWIWPGAKWKGYGIVRIAGVGVTRRVHRVLYEELLGPIPDGLDLDHVKARGCVSRACCNPWHLEPVTRRVNVLRGASLPAANSTKTHCKRGHELAGNNVRVRRNGWRICRACHLIESKESWLRRGARVNADRRRQRAEAA